jgi:hypothetical protein
VGRQYGLKLTDYPFALALTFWIHSLEIKSMLMAFGHKRVSDTKYR